MPNVFDGKQQKKMIPNNRSALKDVDLSANYESLFGSESSSSDIFDSSSSAFGAFTQPYTHESMFGRMKINDDEEQVETFEYTPPQPISESKIAEIAKLMRSALIKEHKQKQSHKSVKEDLEKIKYRLMGTIIPLSILQQYILPFMTFKEVHVSMFRLSKAYELASRYFPMDCNDFGWYVKRFQSTFKNYSNTIRTGPELSVLNVRFDILPSSEVPNLGKLASFSKHNVTTMTPKLIWYLFSRSFNSFCDTLNKRHGIIKRDLKILMLELALFISKIQDYMCEQENPMAQMNIIIQRKTTQDKYDKSQKLDEFVLSIVLQESSQKSTSFVTQMALHETGIEEEISLFMDSDDEEEMEDDSEDEEEEEYEEDEEDLEEDEEFDEDDDEEE